MEGGGDQKAFGDVAVDTQHGTGVEGSSQPCTEGLLPKVMDFSLYITTHVLLVICAVDMLLVLFMLFSSAGRK